ncbi:hypothetical protein T439DRAFT_317006 [Meredithblackwellia eburnea MCA 4105]
MSASINSELPQLESLNINKPTTTTLTHGHDLQLEEGEGELEQEDGPAGDGAEGAEDQQKKKKKKRRTTAQKKAAAARSALAAQQAQNPLPTPPPPMPVLKISRNKHMKYISSYHGPWLQLPHEVLDSLLQVNCDPQALPAVRGLLDSPRFSRSPFYSSHNSSSSSSSRFKSITATSDAYLGSNPNLNFNDDDPLLNAASAEGDRRLPPPIDPAVFRGIAEIRRLVDESSDLSVRAASGLSSAALGALNGSHGGHHGGTGNSLDGGGRNAAMSPVRQHRLRVLAVSKLAEAYRIDEIAASVAVMQGATGLDDLAVRVLKNEPDNIDAQYVGFFHEKIPSRTLASSTDTTLLDQLITNNPTKLEYYRTRGIVLGFKQDYSAAIRNFTAALSQAKAARKVKMHHENLAGGGSKSSRKKGGSGGGKAGRGGPGSMNGADSGSGGADEDSSSAGPPPVMFGKEPGDDVERQIMFHRGMAHFHAACKIIEDAVLDIEGIEKPQGGLSNEGGEMTLRNIGIVLKDDLLGLYGSASLEKQNSYRSDLGDEGLRDKVGSLLRKSVRDHERFLAHFAVWEAPAGSVLEEEKKANPARVPAAMDNNRPLTFRGRRLIHHRSLCGRTRHSDPRRSEVRDGTAAVDPALLTTYHPLLIESHFTILLNHLLLGDFSAALTQHYKTVRLMDYLEGYPVFLPARSLNQSEYAEVLERLALTWLKKREEETGIPAPDGTEVDIAQRGDLPSLHHLTSFFTSEFVEALVAAAETAEKEAKEELKAKKTSGSIAGLLEGGGVSSKNGKGVVGGWAEAREKADAARRKIDPSFATFNTARAEVALAWLMAIVIPEKEVQEQEGRGKGKQAAFPGMEDDEVEDEDSGPQAGPSTMGPGSRSQLGSRSGSASGSSSKGKGRDMS